MNCGIVIQLEFFAARKHRFDKYNPSSDSGKNQHGDRWNMDHE